MFGRRWLGFLSGSTPGLPGGLSTALSGVRAGWADDALRWAGGWLRHEPLPARPLIVVAAALAAGCGLGPVIDHAPAFVWLAAAGLLVTWLLLFLRGCPSVAGVVLVAAIVTGAAAWCAVRWSFFPASDLAWSLSASPTPVAIQAVVASSPRLLAEPASDPLKSTAAQEAAIRPASECVVKVQAVRHHDTWTAASGRASIVVGGEPADLPVGTRVEVFGRGLRPPPQLNPGEFDFRGRMRSLRCLSIIRVDSWNAVRILAAESAWSPASWVDRIRGRGVAVLRRHVAPERAGLAAALLLGSREALPRDDSQDFLVTGTIHVLSISGLHVGFLAVAVFQVLRMLAVSRGWSLVVVALVTGLYMVLVGAETPVLRATLLVWLACAAAAVGRRATAANSLAIAAIIVLLWHPPELFRIGTQLSFLSTAVLVGAAAALPRGPSDDPIERLIERSRPGWERRLRRIGGRAWEGIVVGTAVWVVTAPIVAARFHLVSPVGLALNPLIAPLVALAMACGAACMLAAGLSSAVAAACGAGCDAALAVIGWLVAGAAIVPGGHVWVAAPPWWWVAGWYLILAGLPLVVAPQRLTKAGTWVGVATAWALAGVAWPSLVGLVSPAPPALRVVVAAMGHGCGIVVRSPGGRCLVYDAGRLGAPSAARRAITAVLWEERVRRIDTLCISHADTDHFNAVPEILDRFTVGEILVPPPFLTGESWALEALLRRARQAGVPVRTAVAGDSFALDPLCRVRVLHPHAAAVEGAFASDNETSLVFAVESAGRRLLLTGDLEGESLDQFVASRPERCDVLVAPHHGSRTTLPPDIARVTAADWVIVSGNASPTWPEVREAYTRARGGTPAAVLSTGAGPDHAGPDHAGPDHAGPDHAGPDHAGPGGAIALTLDAADVRVARFVSGRWRPVPHAAFAEGAESGRVKTSAATISANWLATKPPRSMSTPLVKP